MFCDCFQCHLRFANNSHSHFTTSPTSSRILKKLHSSGTASGNIPVSLDDIKKIPSLLRGKGTWKLEGILGSGGADLLFSPEGTDLTIPMTLAPSHRNHEAPRLILRSMWKEP